MRESLDSFLIRLDLCLAPLDSFSASLYFSIVLIGERVRVILGHRIHNMCITSFDR